MKPLEDMTLPQRVALTVVIVLVILLALAFCSLALKEQAPAATSGAFFSSPFDQRLAQLEHEALDEGYKQRVHLLFSNWLNDTREQPQRMLLGINNARRIYSEAMTEVQKREQQIGR